MPLRRVQIYFHFENVFPFLNRVDFLELIPKLLKPNSLKAKKGPGRGCIMDHLGTEPGPFRPSGSGCLKGAGMARAPTLEEGRFLPQFSEHPVVRF